MAVKKKRPAILEPVAPARTVKKARPAAKLTPARESGMALGSGRTLHVRSVDTGETIEVRTAKGQVEVSITLGPSGPVVTVHGAQELELASPKVAVRCDQLELAARERVDLKTEGEIKLKAQGDVVVNGAFVKLNCDETPPSPRAGPG